jgi:hypothetical protein
LLHHGYGGVQGAVHRGAGCAIALAPEVFITRHAEFLKKGRKEVERKEAGAL